jgi:uncharacterized protein (DUF1778 family)
MSESTNDTYRNRALALRKHAWQFRARWRMAEMEVRDCIRLVEKRTDQYEECHRALTQTEAERDAARAELARVTAERDALQVRDAQWAEKWKAALDLLDSPCAERDAARAELVRVTAERDDMGHEVLRLRAALARAHDVLDEETLIELSWKEAGRVTNMFRAALAAAPAAPDAGGEGA